MITLFKIFEENTLNLEIGDYVVCEDNILKHYTDHSVEKEGYFFIKNNVGKIISLQGGKKYSDLDDHDYLVVYQNVPHNLKTHIFDNEDTRLMNKYEILFFSKNKEECETYIYANKYNL